MDKTLLHVKDPSTVKRMVLITVQGGSVVGIDTNFFPTAETEFVLMDLDNARTIDNEDGSYDMGVDLEQIPIRITGDVDGKSIAKTVADTYGARIVRRIYDKQKDGE